MCVYTRACIWNKEKKEKKMTTFSPSHAVCEHSAVRLISEYLWVIVGGKEKERKKNEKKESDKENECSGFFYIYIFPRFFFCCCSFSATLMPIEHDSISFFSFLSYSDMCYANYTQVVWKNVAMSNRPKVYKKSRKKLTIDKQCHLRYKKRKFIFFI